MRYSKYQNEYTRAEWSDWLKTALSYEDISISRLALELASPSLQLTAARVGRGSKSIRESTPRSLVSRWIDQKLTVSPDNAFRCGEALRRLGVSFASGPHGLIASGWTSALIEYLDRLSRTDNGAWPALALFVGLAESQQKGLVVREWYLDERQGSHDLGIGDYTDKVAWLCKTGIEMGASLSEELWSRCNGGRGCSSTVQMAMSIAQPRLEVHGELARVNAWNMMQPWADSLFKQCGGKPPGRTLYLHWRTSDEIIARYRAGDNTFDSLDSLVDSIISLAPRTLA